MSTTSKTPALGKKATKLENTPPSAKVVKDEKVKKAPPKLPAKKAKVEVKIETKDVPAIKPFSKPAPAPAKPVRDAVVKKTADAPVVPSVSTQMRRIAEATRTSAEHGLSDAPPEAPVVQQTQAAPVTGQHMEAATTRRAPATKAAAPVAPGKVSVADLLKARQEQTDQSQAGTLFDVQKHLKK